MSNGFQSDISIVRFEVDVAKAGEFKLRVNDAAGLQVWVGEGTVGFSSNEASLSSAAGPQAVTVVIDRKVRNRPLKIEVLDGSARATPVGGL